MSQTAVIAAGGFAKRLGVNMPKSLIMYGQSPLIAYVIRSLAQVGVTRFVLCNNRPEFRAQLEEVTARFPTVILDDRGSSSTIQLVRSALPLICDDNLIFAYGHAPRPVQFLRDMLDSPCPVVTAGVEVSSKTKPIRSTSEGNWIEPPYKIDRRFFERMSAAASWGEFFDSVSPDVIPIANGAPGEFNYPADLIRYDKYMKDWSKANLCFSEPGDSEVHAITLPPTNGPLRVCA